MMHSEYKLNILSLNIYIMGHVTFQNLLERTFAKDFPEVNFHSLHLTEYFKEDLLGRLVHWLLRKRIPGFGKTDYDFYRFRSELANSFFARRCLEHNIKTYQPDVLHIHTQGISLLAEPLFKQLPSIVSIDYTTALLATEHPPITQITYKPIIALEKRCFQSAAHIITWSDRARNSVIKDYNISPQKVTTIHPSVPLELFTTMARGQSSNSGKTRLLFVGNDFIRKGGEDLLAVFLEDFSNICELDIVTNISLNLPESSQLRVHRGIRPLSPEILHLYQMADIFVMPTHEDVYGIVFLEAMAAGLPCIGTTVMTVPELVQHEFSGLTIPPGNRQALYQALHLLINNPDLRLSMGMAGRELAIKRADAFSNCQQFLQLLNEIHLKSNSNNRLA